MGRARCPARRLFHLRAGPRHPGRHPLPALAARLCFWLRLPILQYLRTAVVLPGRGLSPARLWLCRRRQDGLSPVYRRVGAGHVWLCPGGAGPARRPGRGRRLHGHSVPAGRRVRAGRAGGDGGLCLCAPDPLGGMGRAAPAAPEHRPGPGRSLCRAHLHPSTDGAASDRGARLLCGCPGAGPRERAPALPPDVARLSPALHRAPGAPAAAGCRRPGAGAGAQCFLPRPGHGREPLCSRRPVVWRPVCLGRRLCRALPALFACLGMGHKRARPRRHDELPAWRGAAGAGAGCRCGAGAEGSERPPPRLPRCDRGGAGQAGGRAR